MFRILINQTLRLDTFLIRRMFGWNGRHALDRAMLILTKTGDGYYYPFILLVIWGFARSAADALLLAAAVGFGMEQVLYHVLKRLVKRMRPFEQLPDIRFLIRPPDRFSFPSGHTAAAFLMATLLCSLFPAITLPVFGWAILVGISRVYLGVHYPTDILAGAVLGLVTAHLGLLFI